MFKKDDYIVLLKYDDVKTTSKNFLINHCYKQRQDYSYLSPYLDSRGSCFNGWSLYDFEKNRHLWRYATKQESAEYERLGKPYDVSTLKPKFEVGKWYRWYQSNHQAYHIGKVRSINVNDDNLDCSPWICREKEYYVSGSFLIKYSEQIEELTDLSKIQDLLPDDHPDKIKTMNEFQENKWYKHENGAYGKFMLKNGRNEYPDKFPSKEYIDRNKKYHNDGTYFSIDEILPGEVPISEIAEYLPKNHPDLKKTSGLSFSDIKAGEYYYAQYSEYESSGKCIIRAKNNGNFDTSSGLYTDRLAKEYNVFYYKNGWSCDYNIRLATKEEREWLDACINAKVFVPKPSSKQSKSYSLQVDQWYSFEVNSSTQYGMFSKVSFEFDSYYFDHWIINGSQYHLTGCFDRSILKSIKEVSFEDVLSNVSEQARKRLLEIFPKKVSTEELNRKLLNEVIEKYPIGTRYMSIDSNGDNVGVHEIIKKPYVYRYHSDGRIKGIVGDSGHNFIYVNGYWAKKLGSTEQTASSINLASDQHSLFLESASSTNLVTLSSGPLFTEPQSSFYSSSPSDRLEVREEQQTKKQLTKINKLSFTKI